MSRLPLEGVRVTDLTMFWSGPLTTQTLAVMGAEVIKIESTRHIDFWRGADTQAGDNPYERSSNFNAVNCNKLGITLDLAHPRGIEIFKKLVSISDVVAENFSTRVTKNLGLDYPKLKQVKPDIIMLSLPAFGLTGPWANFVGFGATVEQMSGFAQLQGYPGGSPMRGRAGPADPIAGLNGALAVLIALHHHHLTGEGQHIDLSQVEAVTSTIGDVIMDYTMNKRVWPRRGNRHPFVAPQGCYRCKGDDEWVTITILSDEEWQRFCDAIGNPPWPQDERFSHVVSRRQSEDELDRLIEGWTINYSHYEVMHLLQKRGIAAGPVLTGAEMLSDPHLRQRGFHKLLNRAFVGTHAYPDIPIRLSKTPASISFPGPCLGEHNEYIFGELLGMSKEDIAELAEEGIIGTTPPGL